MEFLILVHCAALRKETSQSEEKVTTSGYCTKIKVNNCLCTYIHLYTVVEASWSRIYCTVNVFAKKNLVLKVTQIEYGPFKYYVIKDVGWWGQKMAILYDLQYCKSSKRWVGGSKKVKNMMT